MKKKHPLTDAEHPAHPAVTADRPPPGETSNPDLCNPLVVTDRAQKARGQRFLIRLRRSVLPAAVLFAAHAVAQAPADGSGCTNRTERLIDCAAPTTPAGATATAVPKETEVRASYAIGLNLGREFHENLAQVNAEAIAEGLKDGLAGTPPRLSDTECREALTSWQTQQRDVAFARRKELAEKNAREGEKFLAENRTREGIKTLPSGLQYRIVKEGKGALPKGTSTVKTHCRGRRLDGTEFFSTYADNEPVTFVVNKVLPGWSEVLPLMKVGSRWELFVPSRLAYGEEGAQGKVGPNATVIFDMELLSIEL